MANRERQHQEARQEAQQAPAPEAQGPNLEGAVQALLGALRQGPQVDPNLEAQIKEYEAEEAALLEQLKKVREKLGELRALRRRQESQAAQAMAAVAAALQRLGLDPSQYGLQAQAKRPSGNGNGPRRTSTIRVLVNGQDNPAWASPSEALWYGTPGCGGSAKGGRLTMSDLYKQLGDGDENRGVTVFAEGGWVLTLRKEDGRTVELRGVKVAS